MRYLAAYLLAAEGGNSRPDETCIQGILDSVGAPYDKGQIASLVSELDGKDLRDLIAKGRESMASVVAAAPSAAPAASESAGRDKEAEVAKEEEEEDDDAGDFALDFFGDD